MNHQYVPRDYLDAAIASVFAEFAEHWSTLLVMATGVGKTEAYLQVAQRFLAENPLLKVLILAHREELISQPALRWHRNTGTMPLIEMGELRSGDDCSDLFNTARRENRLVIATTQTLNSGRRCRQCTADCTACDRTGKVFVTCPECSGSACGESDGCCEECGSCDGSGKIKKRCKPCEGDGWVCTREDCQACFEHFCRRMQKFKPTDFGLVIVDEAHHAPADTYTRVVRYFRQNNPALRLLGLTATPDRADEDALGQVFESVAYTYSLPAPITDGWLTPVDQRFILVDELNLANVRTTAGDLNEGDLEREMLVEKVLHKVTTPIVEISCGLSDGTIDQLLKSNRLGDLPELCTCREPTLIHAASVAHAQRMTEILNRYLPESALCIVGTTNRQDRREGLERFAAGAYQFLLSCGVFLEGTDLPNVSIVGMARPTKSRALYAQMLGRGLRPLSGLIDGVATPQERVALIAGSRKPKCIALDFVDNSGRHKLVSAADILGDAFPDELVSKVKRKMAKSGQPLDVLTELTRAREEAEAARRKKARREADQRRLDEEERARKASEGRAGIVAGASYTQREVNPFDVFEVAPQREPGYHRGRVPSEGQLGYLRKAGVDVPADASFWDAHQLCEEVTRRRKDGLGTFRQVKALKNMGFGDADTWSFERCNSTLDAKLSSQKYRARMAELIGAARTADELTALACALREVKTVLPPSMYSDLVDIGRDRRRDLATGA